MKFKSISRLSNMIKSEKLNRGFSSDEKYRITMASGEHFLIRTNSADVLERYKREFLLLTELECLGLPCSRPIEYGLLEDDTKVYAIYTWCEGEDAKTMLSKFSEETQYELGLYSGKILKAIHSLPCESNLDWEEHFNAKVNKKIDSYINCGVSFNGEEFILEYIEKNRHLIANRPIVVQHGDYHVGNMVISDGGELSIIDFNRMSYGDPWDEFNRIVWTAEASPHFASGQLIGYFDGRPPDDFFALLMLYISSNMLSSVSWAIPFGAEHVEIMIAQSQMILDWFDNMKNPVPNWYIDSDKDY